MFMNGWYVSTGSKRDLYLTSVIFLFFILLMHAQTCTRWWQKGRRKKRGRLCHLTIRFRTKQCTRDKVVDQTNKLDYNTPCLLSKEAGWIGACLDGHVCMRACRVREPQFFFFVRTVIFLWNPMMWLQREGQEQGKRERTKTNSSSRHVDGEKEPMRPQEQLYSSRWLHSGWQPFPTRRVPFERLCVGQLGKNPLSLPSSTPLILLLHLTPSPCPSPLPPLFFSPHSSSPSPHSPKSTLPPLTRHHPHRYVNSKKAKGAWTSLFFSLTHAHLDNHNTISSFVLCSSCALPLFVRGQKTKETAQTKRKERKPRDNAEIALAWISGERTTASFFPFPLPPPAPYLHLSQLAKELFISSSWKVKE